MRPNFTDIGGESIHTAVQITQNEGGRRERIVERYEINCNVHYLNGIFSILMFFIRMYLIIFEGSLYT